MTMTKSRRAGAKSEPTGGDWNTLATSVGVADFEQFAESMTSIQRRGASAFRSSYPGNRTCAYDQATHSMFLSMIGTEAALNELLRRAVAMLSGRVDQLERELKSTKARQTKSLDRHFSLEDLEVEQIDDRNIKIALVRGDKEAAFNLKFPVVLNRGVWNERAHYEKGDGVTHGGSWWIARKDSPGRPGDGTWQLTVKRGSDGKGAGA
jgi:hypothetical protein